MKKYLVALLAITAWISCIAQEKNPPDWNNIEFEVNNPSSEYYYPRLMERYVVADTSLTLDEYYHLYYGYVFQPSYKPLLRYPESDSLDNLFSHRSSISYNTFIKASKYANELVKKSPFSLRDINLLAYTLDNLDQKEAAAREMRKLQMLQQVILSTGSGLKEKSPYYIVLPSNGDDIIGLKGLTMVKSIICSADIVFIQVSDMPKDMKKYKGFYFDISQVYKRKPEYLDEVEQPKRHMEINKTRPWELKK
ncbi:MAG: DUF4919 domain-containing protein [Rikenellaceae bacterium]